MPLPLPVEPDLAAACRGDPAARAALVARHGALVWGLCRRLTPDPEDAFQEIWARALDALPRFDPAGPARFSTWLVTLTHRHLIDRHRRRKVRGEVLPLGEIAAPLPSPEAALDSRRREQRLEAALAHLPEDQRRVVVLHHLAGCGLDEIAAIEGVPVGTLKSRLHRGRARLVELLGDPP